jgi:hypothetical protein
MISSFQNPLIADGSQGHRLIRFLEWIQEATLEAAPESRAGSLKAGAENHPIRKNGLSGFSHFGSQIFDYCFSVRCTDGETLLSWPVITASAPWQHMYLF